MWGGKRNNQVNLYSASLTFVLGLVIWRCSRFKLFPRMSRNILLGILFRMPLWQWCRSSLEQQTTSQQVVALSQQDRIKKTIFLQYWSIFVTDASFRNRWIVIFFYSNCSHNVIESLQSVCLASDYFVILLPRFYCKRFSWIIRYVCGIPT